MKMKYFATIIVLMAVCCSCANTSTVNILIANRSNHDTTNVKVSVLVSEVMKHLDMQPTDTLLLLNEKNRPVAVFIDRNIIRNGASGEFI